MTRREVSFFCKEKREREKKAQNKKLIKCGVHELQ